MMAMENKIKNKIGIIFAISFIIGVLLLVPMVTEAKGNTHKLIVPPEAEADYVYEGSGTHVGPTLYDDYYYKIKAGKKVSVVAPDDTDDRKFKSWKIVSGEIDSFDANSRETIFTMPEMNVTLSIEYEYSEDMHRISVQNGYVSTDKNAFDKYIGSFSIDNVAVDLSYYYSKIKETEAYAKKGDVVYVCTKDDPITKKKVFSKWKIVSGDAKQNKTKSNKIRSSAFTSFVIGDEDVVLKPVYGNIPKEGKKISYKGNNYKVVYSVCMDSPKDLTFEGIVELAYTGTKGSNKKIKIPEYFEYKNITYRVSKLDCNLAGNQELQSLTLPTTLKYIGYNTFAGCSNLKKITITGKTKISSVSKFCEYSRGAFLNIADDAVITVPKKQLDKFKKYLRKPGYNGYEWKTVIDESTGIKGK